MKKALLLFFFTAIFPVQLSTLKGQYYDSTRDSSAASFVDSVAQSVGPLKFRDVPRTYAFPLARTLGEIDRNSITPDAFVSHVIEAAQVRTRFYPEINSVNFNTYLLPFRIRAEDCSNVGWRKTLRDTLEPQILGVATPAEAAAKVLAWCKKRIHLIQEDRCYRLGLKGDMDPLSTLKSGYASEVDLSIFAIAALRSVGVASRLVTAPAIAGEMGGKVWIEYRTQKGWTAWVPSAPDGVDGKQYLLQQFGGRFGLILANPPEPINITASYVPVAHLEVTLNNLNPQERPGWNLLVAGKDQLYPITGRNIYVQMSDSLDVGSGSYVLVAGDHTICGVKSITLKAGESGSYTLDSSEKGSQEFEISGASYAAGADAVEMNPSATRNPALW
jgi:hypothetical protein